MNRQKQHRGAAAALAVLVLAAVLLFVGGSWLEKRSQKPETRTELPQETAETMEVDGVTYRRRTDLTTILVMGIDHDSEVEAEGSYQGGQADFQRLIVIDSKDKTVRQLKIDRDTMAEVTVLGMLGNPVGTTQMQISLAHGFGDGKEESCGYARDAVSRLLQGENIDFYLAMSLDGISVLNDLAGGVTVTLEDDFSAADPAMTKGATLTLQGDQAEILCAGAWILAKAPTKPAWCGRRSILHSFPHSWKAGCSRISSSPHRCTMRCNLIWSPTLQRVSWSMRCGPQRTILWNLPLHWRASIRWQRTDSPSSIRPKLPSRKRF